MTTREDVIAVCHRDVPESHFSRNLFGENKRILSWCKQCKMHHPLINFYRETKSKSNSLLFKPRKICVDCHDMNQTVRKLKKDGTIQFMGRTLESYLGNNND
jgi:superfamily II helicase